MARLTRARTNVVGTQDVARHFAAVGGAGRSPIVPRRSDGRRSAAAGCRGAPERDEQGSVKEGTHRAVSAKLPLPPAPCFGGLLLMVTRNSIARHSLRRRGLAIAGRKGLFCREKRGSCTSCTNFVFSRCEPSPASGHSPGTAFTTPAREKDARLGGRSGSGSRSGHLLVFGSFAGLGRVRARLALGFSATLARRHDAPIP